MTQVIIKGNIYGKHTHTYIFIYIYQIQNIQEHQNKIWNNGL